MLRMGIGCVESDTVRLIRANLRARTIPRLGGDVVGILVSGDCQESPSTLA